MRHGDEAGDVGAVDWRDPTVQVALAATLMSVIGVSLVSPALPAVRSALEVTDAQAGLLITVFTLPGVVLAPVLGVFIDRYGRRRVLVPGLFLYGVTGAAIGLTAVFPLVLLLRFLQGIGASGLIILSLTIIGDHFSGPRRNTVMGVNSAVRSVGAAGGTVVGGWLATFAWNLPFVVYAVSVLVGLVALRSFEDVPLTTTPVGLGHLRETLQVIPTRPALALYATKFAVSLLLFGGVLTALPFLLDGSFGLSSAAIGLVLGLQPAVTAGVGSQNGRLARRVPTETLVVAGFAVDGLGLAMIWFAESAVAVALAIGVLFGVGQGLLMPSLDTAISGLATDQYRGSVMSIEIGVHNLAQTIGPVLFATLGIAVGYRPLLALAGSIAFVLGLGALVVIRRRPP